MGEPTLRFLHGGGVEPARHGAAGLATQDQAGAFEHVEMLEHRRQRHGERFRQRRDGKFTRFAQARQHGTPGRVRERREDAVEEMGLIVNH